VRKHLIGILVAASATLVTGVGLSPAAQAAGSVWDGVAACESGGNWAISTGNGYYGGLQFSSATWAGFGGTRYAAAANRASKGVQIAIAQRVLAVQGPGAWPVCGPRAGLSQANGRASGVTVSRSQARRPTVVRPLVVDGVMGPATIKATQRWAGIKPNGVFRARSVKALQRRLGVSQAGVIGPRTMRALQIRVSARCDGARHLNPATVAALQRYLNQHSR